MAAISPPDPIYSPSLPKELIKSGDLSLAQLESVVYAGQAHNQKLVNGETKGFFIGDGTGVGKGREISGIIMDNFNKGKNKAVWISKSASLYEDAIRDWTGIGGNKDLLFNLSKTKLGQPVTNTKGILFTTYHTLKTEKDNKKRPDSQLAWQRF